MRSWSGRGEKTGREWSGYSVELLVGKGREQGHAWWEVAVGEHQEVFEAALTPSALEEEAWQKLWGWKGHIIAITTFTPFASDRPLPTTAICLTLPIYDFINRLDLTNKVS